MFTCGFGLSWNLSRVGEGGLQVGLLLHKREGKGRDRTGKTKKPFSHSGKTLRTESTSVLTEVYGHRGAFK